jgi:hypothetical protein
MSYFDFSGTAPHSVASRLRRRSQPHSRIPAAAGWVVGITALVYSTGNPGEFTIGTASPNTTDRYAQVRGAVENPSVSAVRLDVNGSTQRVAVTNGLFSANVPLLRGENRIQASVEGAAANLVPASNMIRINAQIAPAAIWSALTWDGTGDVDLHLVLPDGRDCYYKQPRVGPAVLDFDNTVGDGPEHIVVEQALPGKYQVLVKYFAAAGPPRNVRWWLDLRLKDGRERYNYSGVLEKVGEVQTATTFSFP